MNDQALRAAVADESLAGFDESEAAAAERDVERIRRGLDLLARDLDDERARRRVPRWVGVAASLAAAAAGVVVLVPRHDARPVARATAAPGRTGATSVVPDRGWQFRARNATTVVVGTVSHLTHGTIDLGPGAPVGYTLADVDVSETVKGTAGDVTAFAFDEADASTAARTWNVGDRVVLFLVQPEAGWLSSSVPAAHLDLFEGLRSRYDFDGEALDAPFTLDELRAEVTAQ